MAGSAFYLLMFFVYFILLGLAYLSAVLLITLQPLINSIGYNMGAQVWESFFGSVDKIYVFLLMIALLSDAYISYKMPDHLNGILNIGMFFFIAFMVNSIVPVASQLSALLQGENILPIMTAVYTNPLIAYPIMAFTVLCAIFNFRNANYESAPPMIDNGYYEQAPTS
jgi:hypothetical protein